MDSGTAIELCLWTVVVILGGFIVHRVRKIGPFKPTVMEIPPIAQKPVQLRDFSPAELLEYTGTDPSKPILFSVKGKVYDVSSGRSFYGPGGGYSVFAGHECARALATMSTKPEDVGSGSLDGLAADEIDTLDQWIAKFDSKYTHVGSLSSAKN